LIREVRSTVERRDDHAHDGIGVFGHCG
jgi:hypothetical protein